MASKEQILAVLAGESGPMNKAVLSKRLGVPTSGWQSQADRMEKQGLIEKNEEKEYTITEVGRQFALAQPPEPPEPPPPEPGEETEESLKTTEYQQFIKMGKDTGVVPLALIEQVATHVWRGGDYKDLDWVWQGIAEMGIRPDLARRWFHSWRSFLHQPIPADLVTAVAAPQSSAEKTAKVEALGKERDYILVDDMPVRVGQGVGDFDLETAKELAALRALKDRFSKGGTASTGAAPPAATPPMDQRLPDLITALKDFMKNPNDDAVNTLRKELSDTKLDALKQDIISRIPQVAEPKSFIQQLSEFGTTMKDIGPIFKSMLGISEPPAQSTVTPVLYKDKDGNVLDINSIITLKKYEGDERRADVEQKAKEETGAAVRDFLGKIGSAATKMASRE